MDLNAAAVFAKVVEAKGFSSAGRLLGMPKTTVSKKVGDLETQLGVRLLNRTTRSVSLTEAGARVHAHYLAALTHIDAAEREARAMQREPEGPLTVAAPSAISVVVLFAAVDQFMRRYPAVQVTLLAANDLIDLDESRVDVLIWAGGAPPPGRSVRSLALAEVGLYASADYLARHGAPARPEDLASHAVIAFTQVMAGNRFVWRLRRANAERQIVPVAAPRFRSNDATAVMAAVVSGHGIGGLPIRVAQATASGMRLTPVLPDWRAAPIELWAIVRDGSADNVKTRLFLDFLAEQVREAQDQC